MLAYLNSQREQILRFLDDANVTPGTGICVDRLRKESEYAFNMAQIKESVAGAYLKLAAVNAQIVLFLNTAAADESDSGLETSSARPEGASSDSGTDTDGPSRSNPSPLLDLAGQIK
jgi:hypothetical protein